MIETKEVEIGEHRYVLKALDAIEGRRLLANLVKALGPALKGADMSHGGMSVAASILGGACAQITPELVDEICDAFAKRTEVKANGKSAKLSEMFGPHFSRKYSAMVQWLGACLEFNFADFLEDGSLMSSLKNALASKPASAPTTPEPSPSPTT
jgi:hypothetical protein